MDKLIAFDYDFFQTNTFVEFQFEDEIFEEITVGEVDHINNFDLKLYSFIGCSSPRLPLPVPSNKFYYCDLNDNEILFSAWEFLKYKMFEGNIILKKENLECMNNLNNGLPSESQGKSLLVAAYLISEITRPPSVIF